MGHTRLTGMPKQPLAIPSGFGRIRSTLRTGSAGAIPRRPQPRMEHVCTDFRPCIDPVSRTVSGSYRTMRADLALPGLAVWSGLSGLAHRRTWLSTHQGAASRRGPGWWITRRRLICRSRRPEHHTAPTTGTYMSTSVTSTGRVPSGQPPVRATPRRRHRPRARALASNDATAGHEHTGPRRALPLALTSLNGPREASGAPSPPLLHT